LSIDPTQLAVWNGEINRQAALIGYLNDFRAMMICSLVLIPLLFLMRRPPLLGGR
jgi:MFS transporter, DHA2 family, multidrug resistance protein